MLVTEELAATPCLVRHYGSFKAVSSHDASNENDERKGDHNLSTYQMPQLSFNSLPTRMPFFPFQPSRLLSTLFLRGGVPAYMTVSGSLHENLTRSRAGVDRVEEVAVLGMPSWSKRPNELSPSCDSSAMRPSERLVLMIGRELRRESRLDEEGEGRIGRRGTDDLRGEVEGEDKGEGVPDMMQRLVWVESDVKIKDSSRHQVSGGQNGRGKVVVRARERRNARETSNCPWGYMYCEQRMRSGILHERSSEPIGDRTTTTNSPEPPARPPVSAEHVTWPSPITQADCRAAYGRHDWSTLEGQGSPCRWQQSIHNPEAMHGQRPYVHQF